MEGGSAAKILMDLKGLEWELKNELGAKSDWVHVSWEGVDTEKWHSKMSMTP